MAGESSLWSPGSRLLHLVLTVDHGAGEDECDVDQIPEDPRLVVEFALLVGRALVEPSHDHPGVDTRDYQACPEVHLGVHGVEAFEQNEAGEAPEQEHHEDHVRHPVVGQEVVEHGSVTPAVDCVGFPTGNNSRELRSCQSVLVKESKFR